MNQAGNWKIHYLQNGDAQLERTRLVASMYDALIAACTLRQRHTIQHVSGPNGARFDAGAIEDWCAENVK